MGNPDAEESVRRTTTMNSVDYYDFFQLQELDTKCIARRLLLRLEMHTCMPTSEEDRARTQTRGISIFSLDTHYRAMVVLHKLYRPYHPFPRCLHSLNCTGSRPPPIASSAGRKPLPVPSRRLQTVLPSPAASP